MLRLDLCVFFSVWKWISAEFVCRAPAHHKLHFRWSLWILILHHGDEGKIGREHRKGKRRRGEHHSVCFKPWHLTRSCSLLLVYKLSQHTAGLMLGVLEERCSNPVRRASQGEAGSDLMHLLGISIQSAQLSFFRPALRTFTSQGDVITIPIETTFGNNWLRTWI